MAIEYPTITKVGTRYGAPMGREAWKEAPEGPVKLFRLPLEDGAYDFGGAYWGAPDNLWCATDGSNFRAFVRAETFQEAADAVHTLAQTWGLLVLLEHDALSDVVTGYIRCLFFCNEEQEDDDGTTPFEGKGPSDLSEQAHDSIQSDCFRFLEWAKIYLPKDFSDWEQLGQDFYYDRCGHGVGARDRPEVYGGEEIADQLSEIAKDRKLGFGETYEYVGDDGKVYV